MMQRLSNPLCNYSLALRNAIISFQTKGTGYDLLVALYFFEDGLTDDGQSTLIDRTLTYKLEVAYKDLAKMNKNFEVVLLYLYDTCGTVNCSSEDSFWKLFKYMPWLALLFKDRNHKKLIRIFGYPNKLDDVEEAPTLVVIGPNCEFIDPCGADILMRFGIPAYPFTRKNLAKLETEKAKELKLEMLWDRNTIFKVNKDDLEPPSCPSLMLFTLAVRLAEGELLKLKSPVELSDESSLP